MYICIYIYMIYVYIYLGVFYLRGLGISLGQSSARAGRPAGAQSRPGTVLMVLSDITNATNGRR